MKKLNELKVSQAYKEILTEMIHMAHLKVEDVDFESKDWFDKHAWKEEEQEKFIAWMIEYLNDKNHLKEVAPFPSIQKSKRERKSIAYQFVLNYGWRVNYES